MSQKIIITQRGVPRAKAEVAETSEAHNLGCSVEYHLPQGTLVSGDIQRITAAQARGFRIKLLRDTNILTVGTYQIDIEKMVSPKVPAKLEVPKRFEKTWPHHLLQLISPHTPEWIQTIEERGLDVVEPISNYGLFVVGSPEDVKRLLDLPFVAWVGPFKPAYRLQSNLPGRRGRIKYVSIGVYNDNEVGAVRAALEKKRAKIVREFPQVEGYHGEYTTLITEVNAGSLSSLACLPGVRWLEYAAPEPGYDGERESQIVAENLNAAETAPVTGYQAGLTGLGLSGAGVTVAICDSGVDANATNNVNGHLDLRGRQTAFVDYTGGGAATDTNGHGTHVIGIAVGNAATGETEAAAPNDFLWGQGMAPQADFVTINGTDINQGAPWPINLGDFVRDAINNNADAMNNSWWDGSGTGIGYTANSRRLDQLVRDADDATALLESLAIVFSAGNSGGLATTITSPKEAKNIIVVGSSLTSRPGVRFPSDNIDGISAFSSRGPAVDTRILPNVVAPGQDVSSVFSDTSDTGPQNRVPIPGTGAPDPADPGNLINQYLYLSGTSMSAPHVTGLYALLTEWWRNRTNGSDPSPAMLKALVINGAEDLGGGENWRRIHGWALHAGSIYRRNALGFTPNMVVQGNTTLTEVATLPALNAAGRWFYDNVTDILYVRKTNNAAPGNDMNIRDAAALPNIPNEHQGWGRVSLENIVLQHPNSDRGPRVFSDQRHAFTADGQEYMIRIAASDAGRPIRITLAWTDAPAAAGDNPALENDLDLEVIELATGDIYMGNINFINGFSTSTAPGDAFDDRNNVECVYIENPNGIYEVRVIAGTLRRNARPPFDVATLWQDFALVLDNVEVPSAAPVSVVPVIDRSNSMNTYGYVDITITSSKQFVDLMSIDDQVAVVSFGSTAGVEYPTGAAPVLQTITGQPVQDAAIDEIDNISFGGCTYMGQGIEIARDLLNPAAGLKAMVLLSDGYDNKGCQETNAARPWAIGVAAALPADIPVYSCAMGPTSDQVLLAQIAEDTDGRYYYMPVIDDLFEIYNYIRGQVTGDSIIVNDSATASSSRMPAFVDSLATEATFSISWAAKNIIFVPGNPAEKNEISIRLRDPHGRLLHSACSYLHRTVGDGYVIFKLQDPAPGQWYIEVRTARSTHVRYTVGGFVRSPLKLVVPLIPRQIVAGMPIQVVAQMFDGKLPIKGFKAISQVIAPSLDIKGLLRRYRTELRDIRPDHTAIKDNMPVDIVKLGILRNRMLQENKPDIFKPVSIEVPLRNVTKSHLRRTGLGHLLPHEVIAAVPGEEATRLSALPVNPVARAALEISGLSTRVSGAMTGRLTNTKEKGSYNVIVTATGISPVSNTRFVRKEMVSVLIK